jgi:hypothetical protein
MLFAELGPQCVALGAHDGVLDKSRPHLAGGCEAQLLHLLAFVDGQRLLVLDIGRRAFFKQAAELF